MTNKLIKIILADDHFLMREGLASLLGDVPDIQIVGLAENGAEAIIQAQKYRPDIALMDISMEGIDGLEATRQILALLPNIKVIVLTMHEEKAFLLEALKAGAVGYFLKGSDSNELIRTIRSVHKGEVYISPKIAGGLVEEYLSIEGDSRKVKR